MAKRLRYFIPFLILISILSCQKGRDKDIIAMINGRAIRKEQFIDFLKSQGIQSLKDARELRRNLLEQFIEERLILQEAERLGIKVSDFELDATLKALKDKSVYTEDGGLDKERWKERMRDTITVNKVIRKILDSAREVDEKDALEYYKKHPDEFKTPERVRALQIVVNTEEKARDILKQLKRGSYFRRLAKKYSLSPDARDGGDLGYFSRGEMPEEFERVVFSLKKGELSDVIKSPYGYHIFKLIDKKKPGLADFDEVKDEILLNLRAEMEDKAYNSWLKRLKERATVKIYEEAL